MADITWRENFMGFVPEADWLNIGFQVTRPNDPIDGLFADLKTDNLVAQWQTIASEYQLPFMAHFHGFDTEANTTFRVPVDTHNIEKGLIKVKMNQSERLRELMRAGVQGDSAIYDYVVNDGLRLADGVVTRTKVAKNELMATGQVTIKENNLDLTVDYGVPAANLAHTLIIGDGEDVPGQIQEIVDAAIDNGVTITGILTSRKVLAQLRGNKSIQQAINGNLGIGAIVRNGDLRNYLEEEFGISQIIVNDLTYAADATISASGRPNLTTRRYYPQNKITFFETNAAGRMGVGLWGDPPEADAGRFHAVSGSGVSPYVYLMQWMETDPAVLWTKASALFMPVLYNPKAIYVATVSEAPYSITVTPSKASVATGATKKLRVTTVPSDAEVTWSTSDSTYATVDDGIVTGVASGSATITGSISDGVNTYEDVCNVTVT